MAATQNAQTPGSIAYVTAPATSGPIQVNAAASSPNQRFKVRAAKITGGLQIACAVLSVIFGVFEILIAMCAIGDVNTCRNYDGIIPIVGYPIWGGILFYGVAGILGVCSGNRNKCVIVAYMVMSIISSAIAFGQIIMESGGAAINVEYCNYNGYTDNNGTYRHDYTCYSLSGLQAMYSLSAVVAFVEMVVAIVSAAYCCHGVCCQPSSPAPQLVIVQYQPVAQGEVFQQPPPGPFYPNTPGNFYSPPTAPLQQDQMLHQPPDVQPGNPPPQYEEVNDGSYQKLVEC